MAAEKLTERQGLTLSDEPLRRWLRERGISHSMRQKRPHRAWRERKAQVGELVPLAGSHHDWFEGRGPRGVLMAYLDDASRRVCARFYAQEGTIPALDRVTRDVTRQGIPLAVSADTPTTDQSLAPPTVNEPLAGVKPTRPFGRALGELGVERIPAHSPQAKGRVERLFQTFQARVIKEMRLADVSTLEAAHQCLPGYLPIYTQRFAVQPAQPTDLHGPRPAHRELARSLCLKTTRCLRRDWTVAHHGHLYQVPTNVRATHVIVEDRVDGTMRMSHNGRPLPYQAIVARPLRVLPPPTIARRPRTVTPTRAHPWRKRLLPTRDAHAAAALT